MILDNPLETPVLVFKDWKAQQRFLFLLFVLLYGRKRRDARESSSVVFELFPPCLLIFFDLSVRKKEKACVSKARSEVESETHDARSVSSNSRA
jgi:hypothetical protein